MTVTENDMIAAGVEEDDLPGLQSCAETLRRRVQFSDALCWDGSGKDTERQVKSPKEDQAIVIVIHRIPRYSASRPTELSGEWRRWKALERKPP